MWIWSWDFFKNWVDDSSYVSCEMTLIDRETRYLGHWVRPAACTPQSVRTLPAVTPDWLSAIRQLCHTGYSLLVAPILQCFFNLCLSGTVSGSACLETKLVWIPALTGAGRKAAGNQKESPEVRGSGWFLGEWVLSEGILNALQKAG